MFPQPVDIGKYFHEAFRVHPDYFKKRLEWKKLKKKPSKVRAPSKNRMEIVYDSDCLSPPEMELPGNPSAFAVFASIRLTVLDRWMRQASQVYLQSSCSTPKLYQEPSEFESDSDDNSQSSTYMPMKVSKVVGLGLRAVFELIKECRVSHPALCTKALCALLDVLQGQSPEGLKHESLEVIDQLFELLLDLACMHGPESAVLNDGTHLTAIACACLLSLVVVRGDTGKYLAAAAALLMCPRALSIQNIQMPIVLSALQRSVQGVLLGKMIRPDWITHGIPIKSKIGSFFLKLPQDLQNATVTFKSLASDGHYLYLYTSHGLFKIGTGYGGSLTGHIYFWKPDFYSSDRGSLIVCSGHLYLKLEGRRGCELLIVERSKLLISGSVSLHSRDEASSGVFSDGDNIGTISSCRDGGFVVRVLNQQTNPASLINELPLKLARKCIDIFGWASFDEEGSSHSCNIGGDEEIAYVGSAKEFGLMRTVTGKVFYCGKASALGIKQAGVRTGKWSELVLSKIPKITHITIGHDGYHAVLLAEDGSAFFAGTARRGEDGDPNKIRRAPKPVKPKKMIKIDGQFVVYAACNNGTTALITRDGELLMFGKDTGHADPTSALVKGLKGEFVQQVALGKAHTVALTNKGEVYTFGINNKFQCGRDYHGSGPGKEGFTSNIVAMDTCSTHEEQDMYEETADESANIESNQSQQQQASARPNNICPPGMHTWHDNMCMICTVCRECTGYSISCLSSMSSERNPGQECGCGEGDSGCSICGSCRICAREVVDNSELADLAGMMRLDLLLRDKVTLSPRQRSKIQEQLQNGLEERKNRGRKSMAGSSKHTAKIKCLRAISSTSSGHQTSNAFRPTHSLGTVKDQGVDVERDATRIACLPPAKIHKPSDNPVSQIACGLHHSVLLLQNGQVYTFGSNLYGQLGSGDILVKNSIQHVRLPGIAIQIAAGSNHTVVLTQKGEVYTFGNYQKGQLGRNPASSSPQDSSQPTQSSSARCTNNHRSPWYCIPSAIPTIGPKQGRKATWIGASGDQTFVKIDESLISSVSISKSIVTANKTAIALLPTHEDIIKKFKTLIINKKDGNCNAFTGPEQVDFLNKLACFDPVYNVMWTLNVNDQEVNCYNIIASELQTKKPSESTFDRKFLLKMCEGESSDESNFDVGAILSPELALPVATNCYVTRFQAALNLLCCLDTLTAAHDLHMTAVKEEMEERQLVTGKQYSKEDFLSVNRFENHGGGWGYSGHSIEAIRFMVDTDVLLGGFGLFGGRGEYTAKMKVLDIGTEGGEQEGDGELLAETEEVAYECGPRQKYPLLFDEPVPLQAHRWYVAWCRISGPSSDCGSSGQAMVTTEDQVLFYFKSSKKSNNGTDVNAGQIPQLLYKIITPENQAPPPQNDALEPIQVLSKEFSHAVNRECFQSVLSLLQWSWNTFKWGIVEGSAIKNMYTDLELERLVYISRASLRLIRTYTNEIYPNQITKKLPIENVHLAECIGDVRELLKQILSDNLPALLEDEADDRKNQCNIGLINSILHECHSTFVACFHAFYPTSYLKWTCLCDLLFQVDKESQTTPCLLSAVLCALRAPSVRLRSTFPLLGSTNSSESSLSRGLSPADNCGMPIIGISDTHYYPILVEQMSYKGQMDSYEEQLCQWDDVLICLLKLVSDPINYALDNNKVYNLPSLTRNCCHLLARVVAELVHQCISADDDMQNACGRILHMTTCRFTRTNQSRSWNTGNGSPDAICFQVDRSGISLAGIGVYGGIGHYEYELELLEDQGSLNGAESHTHTQRWNSLEITRGSFVPEDFAPDIIEIKFDHPVPIKENVKYAIRLRNHGGRTNNGDGGLNSVKGSDNTTFTFSTCSLSFNGTTLTRGQIPVIMYYSNPVEYGRSSATKLEQQARKAALNVASTIVTSACNLMGRAREKAEEFLTADVLSNSHLVTTLLPLVLAHISPLATSDPRSAVQILTLIQQLLPHISALNSMYLITPTHSKRICVSNSAQEHADCKVNTTSNHYSWLEGEHPYKPATVSNYRVTFPESVQWMTIEFDPACATAQPEDSLQLYIPALDDYSKVGDGDDSEAPPLPYWPVLHKFTSCLQWPQNSVVLPGHEVIFSLETASDYLKDDRSSAFGFKCLVVGYEWPPTTNPSNPVSGLKHLEAELSFLGGMCAASLMKKDLQLPTVGDEGEIDIEMAETVAAHTLSMHGPLLSKGLALNNPPTVTQALEGMLSYSTHSNERLFLKDFVSCVPGTRGGRLAQWLQPGSRVDPSKCQVLYTRDELRCGWPAVITVLTRDQYSDLVNVQSMKIEVKAIPIDKKELGSCETGRKIPRVVPLDPLAFDGLPPPPLHAPYEPTIRDKMCFHSICAMKSYQHYSFEELRYLSPPVKRSSENMLVRHNNDGSYSVTWTPASIGFYSIVVNIDGYEIEEALKVEVKEPPQGITPPNQSMAKKSVYQPSRLRKFVAQHSAGLRIRAHASLQSEQIGVVHVNGTIAFIDEIHNDDGVWLRLSADTIKQYGLTGIIEAWCLQYNQHLGKTLLLPVEEPRSTLEQVLHNTVPRRAPEINERTQTTERKKPEVTYQVIKCGASGHNIRSKPNLKAPPVGMLVMGNRIGVLHYTVNSDGYWVMLDKASAEQYCFNTDHEAWSLAIGPNNVLYLGTVSDDDNKDAVALPKLKKGYDFSYNPQDANFSFNSSIEPIVSTKFDGTSSTNPFVFGDPVTSEKVRKRERKDTKLSGLPKWFKADESKSECNVSADASGSNGNGITPPGTPKRSQSSGLASGNVSQSNPDVLDLSNMEPESARAESNPSDKKALANNITVDWPQSPTNPRESPSSSSGGASFPIKSGINANPLSNKNKDNCDEKSSKNLTQTGTQTSPENGVSSTSMSSHFSIGCYNNSKEDRLKTSRIGDKVTGKSRPKRAISPASIQQLPTTSKGNFSTTEPVKEAISPSVAESLRAVFAAFLWHEGIVHDAMACASFLKFHPTLPKQGAVVVTRRQEIPLDKRRQELSKEERARQRHSVEVSNAGNYIYIQPAILESLTKSAANASANRHRTPKLPTKSINEDSSDGAAADETFNKNYGYNTISVLPPALKSLVVLWEELSGNCMHAISNQMVIASPNHGENNRKMNETTKNGFSKSDNRERNATLENDFKKSRKKRIVPRNYLEDIGLSSYLHSSGSDSLCELCGDIFPHPVTYHMHQAHPGCGQHAGGKGYNSGGNYCLGWAGNCGDGGITNSSWYLLCEECRDKYMKTNKVGGKQQNKMKSMAHRKTNKHPFATKLLHSPSLSAGLEPHIIMRNNAMFLLELASSADSGMNRRRRISAAGIIPVSENNSPPDCSGPFTPLPPFQCLSALGVNYTPNDTELLERILRQRNFCQNNNGQRPLSDVSVSDNDSDSSKGLRFHRSVSMGTNGMPWTKTGLEGRIIMLRKRNNSSSEIANEGGSSLLCNPSSALQRLVPKVDTSPIVRTTKMNCGDDIDLLQRAVMQFILQQHDLESLRLAMKQALRKAMCRVYAMQGLNWLLKSVTQPICLHDLLWWFVTSLTPVDIESENDDDNRIHKKNDDQDLNVCEHPLSDISIAGDAVHPLPSTFHTLLQTIADLMILLPMGSALQQIAVRCWGLRFTSADHSFLHRSQVFSNISKILSRSEELEDGTVSMHESHPSVPTSSVSVECLKDLTQYIEIKASSRQAMVGSLTDNSTETFWESGDEDRNKTKSLTIICNHHHHPQIACIHIDNCRDLGNKISNVTFYCGINTEEMVKLRTLEVESRLLGGWTICPITVSDAVVIKMELKGPDNSVRVRQIRILGDIDGESTKIPSQHSAVIIQRRNCEGETLRVFRLITSQVFGKLLHGEEGCSQNNVRNSASISLSDSLEPLEESNDLREHMVGILFSRRSKLTNLQKQVIVQIVQAIRKEAERVREEWELMLVSEQQSSIDGEDVNKNPDTYCFEMLSMVLALSGSAVGRAYLSHQSGLLNDLLILLHAGSARVQRQVTSLLRRMLSEITPQAFAKLTGVASLPPKDFGIVSVTCKTNEGNRGDQIGILDIFLSVIAKALTVQVKIKGKSGGLNGAGTNKEITTVTLGTSIGQNDNVEERWWLRGYVNKKLAEGMTHLIKDMAVGKLSDSWANVTKCAIAENIVNLTRLSEEQRVPNVCLKTPTLWLALASLCVLDKDHVERLSSGQWQTNADGQPSPPRPTCSNHDDGETNALIQCSSCGNLCADCDRFLHLHRKTRTHQRQVCKEEEEAIKVELHEGCGRTKLFWLLALADARTFKALIEYRDGGTQTKGAGMSGVCRFCGTTGNSGLLAIGNVCADHECQEYGRTACTKLLSCGHVCGGILGETVCLPCLQGCSGDTNLKQDADDMCMICFTEALSSAPAIQLKCGHVFHLHCCNAVLMKRWAGPRITFSFSLCPICKQDISNPVLKPLLAPIQELYKDVKRKALMRLEYEGLHTVEAIVTAGARFYSDAAGYAMDRYAYYVCHKCNKAYYGGEARCDNEVGENYDPTELVCGACSDIARAQMCPKHGTDFLEYKCRYCCSVAVFFCFGTTHFCNPCHDDFQRVTNLSKNELPSCPAGPKAKQLDGEECPLHVKHPPTGEEFALGCGVCRNAHTF